MNFVPTNTMGIDLCPWMRDAMCFRNAGIKLDVSSTYTSRFGARCCFIFWHHRHVACPYTVTRPSLGKWKPRPWLEPRFVLDLVLYRLDRLDFVFVCIDVVFYNMINYKKLVLHFSFFRFWFFGFFVWFGSAIFAPSVSAAASNQWRHQRSIDGTRHGNRIIWWRWKQGFKFFSNVKFSC